MSLFKRKNKPETGKSAGKSVDKRNRSLKRVSIVSAILFLAVALVFNIFFDRLLGTTLKWDWSAGEQYSIGEVSQGILDGLETDVRIIGLFDENTDTNFTDIRLLLDDYVRKGNGRVSLTYIDPDTTPGIITELDPDGYMNLQANMFVVHSPSTGKAKAVTQNDIFDYQVDQQTFQRYLAGITAEQSFSGAIKYVQSEVTPVLYFTTGHNELDHNTRYSILVSVMENNNFDVRTLDLFGIDEIPDDCAVIIMAEPVQDITVGEKNLILDYLRSGGSLMVLSGFGNAQFPVLNELLAEFNLEISNDRIREGNVEYRYSNDAYMIRAIAPAGLVTPTAVDGWTLVDNVRKMNVLQNVKSWVTTEPVLTTSSGGIVETLGEVEQSSVPATQNIAVLSENNGWYDGRNVTESAKVMLIGSAGMFDDAILGQFGNNIYNLGVFYYGVQWLSNIDVGGSLRIEAKQPVSYFLTQGTTGAYNFSAVLAFIIIPLGLLAAALFVYRRRKHL